jgi:hypothetical protein
VTWYSINFSFRMCHAICNTQLREEACTSTGSHQSVLCHAGTERVLHYDPGSKRIMPSPGATKDSGGQMPAEVGKSIAVEEVDARPRALRTPISTTATEASDQEDAGKPMPIPETFTYRRPCQGSWLSSEAFFFVSSVVCFCS